MDDVWSDTEQELSNDWLRVVEEAHDLLLREKIEKIICAKLVKTIGYLSKQGATPVRLSGIEFILVYSKTSAKLGFSFDGMGFGADIRGAEANYARTIPGIELTDKQVEMINYLLDMWRATDEEFQQESVN